MTSTDGGKTWKGPAPVSKAVSDQAYPWAAVNPATGDLSVLFYDRSHHPNDRMFDATLATGRPGSFATRRVSTKSLPLTDSLWVPAEVPGCKDACASFVGDYNGLAYGRPGTANMVWTDTRRFVRVPGAGSGFTENIFFAQSEEDHNRSALQ